ncbi:30S ribosomal protein S2 [Candidatus Chromulinivorax destructor]|uniref:Small ribosomal subunit protein uS2 n=1 Tax=Candidatus Chromulinivorax destructor TaxID=2066483 RepID=A0A345ZCK6_9BACT|nr:30S ribosomal protein S2 [Candidatus Chromulinivorax destructor]AXK61023.1 30S ribosomal protein S2 [Candidatus Chromulinivorax destructor]
MIDFRDLIQAGLHFGHQKSRWCPKMAPYIWGHRNGVHLIDVSKIAFNLEKAAKFLESVSAKGETILWVGTKKSAKSMVESIGHNLNMPYVSHRWVGGTITNFYQVKKAVTKYLHLLDVIKKADESMYTKKECVVFQKAADRLGKTVGGLIDLKMPVGAIVLIDVRKEATALQEAVSAGVPVVALVDSNVDPTGVDYVIPGNDDSPKAIKLVLDYLAAAAARGLDKKSLQEESEAIAQASDTTSKKPFLKKVVNAPKKAETPINKKFAIAEQQEQLTAALAEKLETEK